MSNHDRIRRQGFAARAVELLMGLALFFSGLIHYYGPYLFLDASLQYRLAGVGVLIWTLPFLVAMQLTVGVSLLAGFAPRLCLLLAGAMFLFFTGAQLSVLARGIAADCGCLGSMSGQIGILSLSETLLLAVVGLFFGFRSAKNREEINGAST